LTLIQNLQTLRELFLKKKNTTFQNFGLDKVCFFLGIPPNQPFY
jgi:hypothetical protein